jgi:hypothetical protein
VRKGGAELGEEGMYRVTKSWRLSIRFQDFQERPKCVRYNRSLGNRLPTCLRLTIPGVTHGTPKGGAWFLCRSNPQTDLFAIRPGPYHFNRPQGVILSLSSVRSRVAGLLGQKGARLFAPENFDVQERRRRGGGGDGPCLLA